MMKNMLIAMAATQIRHQKNILFIMGIAWDYLKFDQFHDADEFFADALSQHSSDIDHAEPDEQSSSESELEIDFVFED